MPRLNSQKTARRLCSADNHLGKGEDDADQYAVDRPEHQHSEECTGKDQTFRAADLPQPNRQLKLRRTKQSGDHDCRQYRHRKIANKPGSAKEEHDHRKSRHNPGQLCLCLILLSHRRPGDRAVDRAASSQRRGKIAHRKCQDLLIIVDPVSVFLRKIIFCEQRLRHDDNRHRQADRNRLPYRHRRKIRQSPNRKSRFHDIQRLDAPGLHGQILRHQRPRRHQKHRYRKFRHDLFCNQQYHKCSHTKRHGRQVDLSRCLHDMLRKFKEFSRPRCATQKLRHLHQDDGRADAGDKSAHHRRRDIVDQFSRPHHVKREKPQRHIRGQHRHCRQRFL